MLKLNPRTDNQILETNSVSEYLNWYSDTLKKGIDQINPIALNQTFELLKTAAQGKHQIFVAGNGGSAAISDHLYCDWFKGTDVVGHPPLQLRSLVSNLPVLTALANDLSFQKVFSWQLARMARPGDVLVLISSSGKSPNILEAAETARQIQVKIIALTGFSGGTVGSLADAHLHVPVNNYGIVEDCHQMIMHVLAQFMESQRAAARTN
jgi:phosphoheptose isomerase